MRAERRLVGEGGVLGAQAGRFQCRQSTGWWGCAGSTGWDWQGGVQGASAPLRGWGLSLQVVVPHPGIGSEELCELDFMTNLFVSWLHHP